MSAMPVLRQVYVSPAFTLHLELKRELALISMQVHTEHLSTATLPFTKKIIKEICPSVLKTKCFNSQKLPFSREVVNTEIGHLFEHILLDSLCSEKIKLGAIEACYKGKTKWDWEIFPKGFFEISIGLGDTDEAMLLGSIAQTAQLMESILASSSSYTVNDKKTRAEITVFPL